METKGIGNLQSQSEGALAKESAELLQLRERIAQLEQENAAITEQYEKKLAEIALETALGRALAQSKAKNAKAVMALLSMDKLSLENGELKGLDEQLAAIRSSAPYLFEDKPRVRVCSAAEHGEAARTEQSLKAALGAYYAN